MKKTLIILFISLVSIQYVDAQFSVSAQLRTRAEMDNGAGRPLADTANTFYYLTQRSRINLDYNSDKYQMRFSLQDVRVWGNGDIYTSTGIFSSTNSVDIYEAWFKIKFNKGADLTIGRQELKIDDQRLISWRNWNQFGLTYDAVVFNKKHNNWDVNVGLSYNNMINARTGGPIFDSELFNSNNLMKTFNFARVKRKFSDNFSASLIATGAGYQKTNDPGVIYMMGTFGAWASFKAGGFEGTANAYYQFGKGQSGKEVNAYMFTVNPGYRTGNIRLGIGLDYLSGDDAESSDYLQKERTFNQMYGAVFAYYGWMNYFSYMKSSTRSGGLMDIYPNVDVKLAEKHRVRGYFHLFSLANKVQIGETVLDDQNLGQELDLMYIYSHTKELDVHVGFSYYFATETLEQVKGMTPGETKSPYWAWVMLTFKPTLFTTAK
jgi:hypothetical protein